MLRVPGTDARPALGQGRGRRRPHRLLAARRASPIARANPGRAGGLLRRRLRDDGAGQRDGGLPGEARRARPTSRMLVSHVLVPPALEAILASPRRRVQGFLAAGHVCSVMGYRGVPADRRALPRADRRHRLRAARHPAGHLPVREAARRGPGRGREPVRAGRPRRGQPAGAGSSSPRSSRSCTARGAASARFPASGLGLRAAYAAFDAERRFDLSRTAARPGAGRVHRAAWCCRGCRSRTSARPSATRCTPEHPLGATMVSSEGACAAYYRHRRIRGRPPSRRSMIADGDRVNEPTSRRCPVPIGQLSAGRCSRTAAAAG